jgi:hypothetical protein
MLGLLGMAMNNISMDSIISYKLNGMSYLQIANIYNVSRQRIQQIIKPCTSVKIKLIARANGKCENCHQPFKEMPHIHHVGIDVETYNDIESLKYLCISCHRKTHGCYYICNQCGSKFLGRHSKIFCSLKCAVAYNHIPVACEVCGKIVMKTPAKIISTLYKEPRYGGHFYCSTKCSGYVQGIKYGFKAHPENAGRKIKKWNSDFVWQTHKDTGFGAVLLSRILNIPSSTITNILRDKRKHIDSGL